MNSNSCFLLIANSANSVVNFRLDLIKALQSSGMTVHVVCPCMFTNTPERITLEGLGVNVHNLAMDRTGLNVFKEIVAFFSLFWLILKIKPVRILSYTIKPVIWGSIAAYFAKVPQRYALITGLGYAFVESSTKNSKRYLVYLLSKFLYYIALNRCHHVFFQNPDDEILFRELGLLKNTIPSTILKGSGVNLSYFQPASLPDIPVFLLVSRLLIDKGVREYAMAAKKLKNKYPLVDFILVGYIDENPESIRQSELNGWIRDGFITYLGKLVDVRPAISSSSVFVLPTFYREGIPRSILEAMAMGRAIITTNTPGCRETVIDNVNGYLIESRSVDDLCSAMECLINNPHNIKKMGSASLCLARKDFDVHNVNAIMLKAMKVNL